MADHGLQSEITAAATYEDLHVSALFGQWAEHVADAARIQPGDRTLDVACGTGALTREVASRSGETGSTAGIDPNRGMIFVAKRHLPTVEWQEGVAEELPYDDGAFDVVVSQFGLMFFQSRDDSIREMLRVLAPGGRIAVAVWDSIENAPAYAVAAELLYRFAGPKASRALRAPFSLGNRKELGQLFQQSGMESGQITTVPGTARFPSIRVMMEAELRGWLPVMGVRLAEEQIEQILNEAEQELRRYVLPDGSVEFGLSAHIVSGTKPAT